MSASNTSFKIGTLNAAPHETSAAFGNVKPTQEILMTNETGTEQAGIRLSRRALTKLAIALGATGASSAAMSSFSVAQGNSGARILLATTTIEDYDRWIKAFGTSSLVKRKQHGSAGATVFRDPIDKSRVWVMFEWDDKGWQAFASDPEVPAIMKEAGHTSKAQVAVLSGRFDA